MTLRFKNMEVHGYTESGSIEVTIHNIEMVVPDDPTNTHRQMIAEWEAEGNTIPPYEPTPEELRKTEFPNLHPDQFWFGLRAAGYEDDVRAWVAALKDTDPVTWAWASSKLEFATFFERDHPLVEAFREATDMSEQELDALWSFAAQ